jgi:hypothetical protein
VTQPVLPPKVPDHVVGDRRKFGVRIAGAERWHIDVPVLDVLLCAVQHDLYQICAVGIVSDRLPVNEA